MPQRIGLEAVFTTTNFNAGLQSYVNSLNQALSATTRAANAIQLETGRINTALNQIGATQGANISSLSSRFSNLSRAATNAASSVQQFIQAAGGLAGVPGLPAGGGRGGGRRGGGGGAGGAGAQQSPLQVDLKIAKLLEDEVKDIAELEKTRVVLANNTSSALQRQLALRKQEVIEARQLVRQEELRNLGIGQSTIDRFRATPRQPSANQRDVEILQLQGEELQDLIVLEQSRRTLADKTSTALQKQLALINQQAVAARQQQRGQRLQDLGIGQQQIDALRNVPVSLRDINKTAKSAEQQFERLNAKTIALGVAVGTLAVRAAGALFNSLKSLAGSVAETVTFFESLSLSIEFYAVRALKAEGIQTDFATGLKLVAREAEGTLIWIQRLALESPFTSQDVGNLFRTAQAYGLLRKEAVLLTPLLLDFAAAAGLDNEILGRLALALGQVRARGKLTGEEVRQLGNSGIPIRDILVEALGIANSEFDELVESGKLTSDIVIPAIIRSLEDFRGAGRRIQFETLGGIISAFKELQQFGTFRLFKGIVDPIKESLLELFETLSQTSVFANLQAIGELVGEFVARAFHALSTTIGNTIKAWNELNPVVKQQIVVFGLTAIAVTVLTASIGLLILVLKLLFSRFVLIGFVVTTVITGIATGFGGLIGIAQTLGNVFGTIFGGIGKLFSTFFKSFAVGGSAAAQVGRTIGDDLNKGFRETRGEIKKEVKEEVSSISGDALIAGSAAGAEFLRGWRIPNPAQRISEELQAALDKFGSGPALSVSGANAVNKFFAPFKNLDFGFFEEIGGTIRDVLANAVNLGEVKETDLPRLLFGGRQAVAQAINEFRSIGAISQRTFDGIRRATGSAGNAIVGFLSTYTRLAVATDVVEAAQEKLNEITDRYKNIITPIRKELEAISELRKQSDENEEVLALQRTLNNEAVSAARKRTAQLRIDEIRTGQRLRGLEAQKEGEEEVANEQKTAAEKVQTSLQKELDLLRARFDAQQANLNIVGEEADIFRQLADEIKKLREKEKTDLEKQLEFLGLINAEIDDAKKLAKAKFDLASGETSEFEKQQALLQIQTIEFERQQRILKATELGFDPNILVQLRDIPVTLKDIGEGAEASFQFDTINDLADELGIKLPDFVEFAEDWNKLLGEARVHWQGIKDDIQEAADAINDNLPTFLKIFPETPGETPPIIENIGKLTAVLFGFAILTSGAKFIAGVAAFSKFIGLTALITGSQVVPAAAGAAGAAGAAAAAPAATGFAGTLVGRILSFIGPIGAIGAAAFNVITEINEANAGVEKSVGDLASLFGPEKANEISNQIDRFLIDSGLNNPLSIFGEDVTTDVLTDRIVQGLQSGESKDQIRTALDSLLTSAGEDTLSLINQDFFATQRTQFLDSLVAGLPEQTTATVSGALSTGLAGLSENPMLNQVLATSIQAVAQEGIDAGLNKVALAELIQENFEAGIAAGLIADTPETQEVIAKYIRDLISALQTESESESPSELFRREVGVPLGEGILLGISDISDSIDNSPELKRVMAAIAAPFKSAGKEATEALDTLRTDSGLKLRAITKNLTEIYDTFFLLIKQRFVVFRADQNNAWIAIRADSTREVTGMKDDLLRLFDSLHTGISELMAKIYALIITNGFAKIRRDAEAEITLMRTNVVNMLVGEEDSLLADITKAIGGPEEGTPAWNIGKNLITGMAQGITDNVDDLIKAMKEAIAETFKQTAAEYEMQSPSQVAARELGLPLGEGVGMGVTRSIPSILSGIQRAMSGGLNSLVPSNLFAPRAGMIPENVSNSSSVKNFNLNVSSSQASQSIISDFAILQVMSSGA